MTLSGTISAPQNYSRRRYGKSTGLKISSIRVDLPRGRTRIGKGEFFILKGKYV